MMMESGCLASSGLNPSKPVWLPEEKYLMRAPKIRHFDANPSI